MSNAKYSGNFNDYGYNVAPPVGSLDIMKSSIMNIFTNRFKDAKEMSDEGFCNLYDCRKIFKNRYDLLTLDSLAAIYGFYSGVKFSKHLEETLIVRINKDIFEKLLSLNGGAWDGYKIETTPLEKLVNIFVFQRTILDKKDMKEVSEELLEILAMKDIKLIENKRD